MSKKFEDLNNTFNVAGDILPSENQYMEEKIEKINNSSAEDVQKDYEYSRGNLYSIIEKGQEALNGILELAQDTESPRAYEVAGQLIKNVSDATDKLIDLQKKLKDMDEQKVKGPTNVTNALFVGSTAELSKLLKSNKIDEK